MKYLSFLIIVAALIAACKKERYGNVKQQIEASSSELNSQLKSQNAEPARYTQFGGFITSVTPTSCIGKLGMVRYMSDSVGDYDMITLVNSQNGEDPVEADFSNNSVISVVPVINGVNTIMQNADGEGSFFIENVTLKLLWINIKIIQTIELPVQYTDITLNQFYGDDSNKSGNILTTEMLPLNQVVSELSVFGREMNFYFGMTPTTFVDYSYMVGNNVKTYQIRSSFYEEWTMTPPLENETKTYISTIGFVNNNIIQIYSGADNIPYTSDDIIVFAPKFWEKIYVNVTEK